MIQLHIGSCGCHSEQWIICNSAWLILCFFELLLNSTVHSLHCLTDLDTHTHTLNHSATHHWSTYIILHCHLCMSLSCLFNLGEDVFLKLNERLWGWEVESIGRHCGMEIGLCCWDLWTYDHLNTYTLFYVYTFCSHCFMCTHSEPI